MFSSVCILYSSVRILLPVIASQHDEGVPGADSSAHRARQHLIRCPDSSRELYVHVGFVLLKVVEVEVAKVVDGVV